MIGNADQDPTHSIASNEMIAREEGREEMRARERQRATTRERDLVWLSLSYLVCVSRSIDDSHDSLRE